MLSNVTEAHRRFIAQPELDLIVDEIIIRRAGANQPSFSLHGEGSK